jgi:hypothetical protein
MCTCIKFVFGNVSDWARKMPELWMEKLLVWRGVEERGERGLMM